ncbi:unnamed protein product [Strongylus vulgaris]|uniref:Uncharacterized protein n=1 Tax=Strongylus vulgaris TaxID=40348 RepID=A0A3P7J9G0_STRVU|nr:unnamed protein product [Strongylus vulgaris]
MAINGDLMQRFRSWNDEWSSVEQSGAHAAAVLLNSTVSLLSLLTIGVVHSLSRHNYHLSKSQSSRLLASSWVLVALLLLADFLLVRTSRSLILAVPFHLALLSVFLTLNLIIHPLNLILLSRSRSNSQEPERVRMLEESATASLWLLLNSLSFIIIVMMVFWETKRSSKEVDSIMGIEMAAYSVHCIANPLIAVIRDRRLEGTLAHILMRNKRTTGKCTVLFTQTKNSLPDTRRGTDSGVNEGSTPTLLNVEDVDITAFVRGLLYIIVKLSRLLLATSGDE